MICLHKPIVHPFPSPLHVKVLLLLKSRVLKDIKMSVMQKVEWRLVEAVRREKWGVDGYSFCSVRRKSSGDGLHNNGNILKTTELYA